MLTIRKLSDLKYEVEVAAATTTNHVVTVSGADLLLFGNIAAEKLIEESFRFLLEREPNTSILSRFELSVIGTYFPEYRAEIRKRLS